MYAFFQDRLQRFNILGSGDTPFCGSYSSIILETSSIAETANKQTGGNRLLLIIGL